MKSNDWRAWLSAGVFVVIGAVIIYLAVEPSTEGEHAPPWVIAASGGVFAVAGLGAMVEMLPGLRSKPAVKARLHSGLGFTLVLMFALIANWIAFGPGERTGEVSVSLPLFGFSTGRGDWLIRAPFACSALLMNLLLVLMVAHGLRRGMRRKR